MRTQAANSSNGSSYIVQKGDNLSKIAQRNGTTVDALLSFNPGLKRDSVIDVGQEIQLDDTQERREANYESVMSESRAAIQQAKDYGYGEDYTFKILPNGDIELTLLRGKTLGDIREDFQIEAGSLSRTNKVKDRFKPNNYFDFERGVSVNDYDGAEVPKGEKIVIERLEFKPNENRTGWDRFWSNLF